MRIVTFFSGQFRNKPSKSPLMKLLNSEVLLAPSFCFWLQGKASKERNFPLFFSFSNIYLFSNKGTQGNKSLIHAFTSLQGIGESKCRCRFLKHSTSAKYWSEGPFTVDCLGRFGYTCNEGSDSRFRCLTDDSF